MPKTQEDWMGVSKAFMDLWNFPHALGAMDGKHIIIQCPFNSGTEYYNYKSQFSIVLMGVVDANYNFIYVDIGAQGRISDGGVLKATSFHEKIEKQALKLPEPEVLNDKRPKKVPYFFLGDGAFPLNETIMKPYSGTYLKGSKERIFNYRLSRARRIVENAFGILASVFRVLRKPMLLQPEKAQLVVMAAIYLHNFLRRSSSRYVYTPPGSVDSENNDIGDVTPGSWRQDQPMTSCLPLPSIPRRSAVQAKAIREELADYFMKEGKLPWQDRYA